jgi:transcriptional regulator of acetoin/glycerol metabolism
MKKILLERLCSQEFIKFNHPFLMAGRTKVPNDETELIRVVGEEVNWNKKMAEIPGISPTTLWRKLKKAGLNSWKLTLVTWDSSPPSHQ